MAQRRVKILWGKEFRLVAKGLAVKDVVAFFESLMDQYRESAEKLEHLDSLRALANRTVEEAERFASTLKTETRKESESVAAGIIAEAKHRVEELLKQAQDMAAELRESTRQEGERRSAKIMSAAETRAQALVASTEASVETAVNEARQEAEEKARELVAEAVQRSQQMISDAQRGARELIEKTRSEAQKQVRLIVREGEEEAKARAEDLVGSAVQMARASAADAQTVDLKGGSRPAAQRRGRARPVLHWTKVPGAARYGLYVARPPYGQNDLAYMREDITATLFTLPIDLEEGVTYQWTVRGGNSKGWGPFAPYKTLNA